MRVAKSCVFGTKIGIFCIKATFFNFKRGLFGTVSTKNGFVAGKINFPKQGAFDMEIND